MTVEARFVIPGIPIAKARPRFFRRGKFVGTYNQQTTEEGKMLLLVVDGIRRQGLSEALPFPARMPLYLHCTFDMPTPKGWSKRALRALEAGEYFPHMKRPDADNLVKFVKDVFNGTVWHDDSQVCQIRADKRYAVTPQTTIRVGVLIE